MSSPPTSVHFHAHGLDEASEQLGPYLRVRYVQLERGPTCFQGAVVRLGGAVVGRCHGSRDKLERFDVPRGKTFALLVKRGLARVGTTTLGPYHMVLAQGPQELVMFTDRECHSLFVSFQDIETTKTQGTRILQLTEAQALVLAESVEAALNDPGGSMLDLASMPHMFASWSRREHMPMRAHSTVAARRNAAVRAREYIDRNLDRRLSLAAVCQASYASPRALEYGFREVFGVPPIVYLRYSRLSCVRRELYRAPRAHGIVTELAMKWGFWHLSQFSKDYYELFGELPSETLSRANTAPCERKGMRKSDSRAQALPAF